MGPLGAAGRARAGGKAGRTGARRAGGRGRGLGRCRAEPPAPAPPPPGDEGGGGEEGGRASGPPLGGSWKGTKKRRVGGNSTDAVATFLTRRFGLAGGLAWFGVLTFGVVSEQVKTRMETAEERAGAKELGAKEAAQEVVLPGGVRARDLKRGGGGPPQDGYLTVVNFQVYGRPGAVPAAGPAEGPAAGPMPARLAWDDDWGEPLHDTRAGRGKPLVFLFGSRPFKQGVCPGFEAALRGMRAGGGKREVLVPAAQGFGVRGFASDTWRAPPDADLKYVLTLDRVSIPP